jgi:hypothetical protein
MTKGNGIAETTKIKNGTCIRKSDTEINKNQT